MTFVQAIKSVYAKFFQFSGRAPRSEFWWYFLFYALVSIPLTYVPYLSEAWNIGNIVPQLAVGCRRLHDIDRAGWWLAMALPIYSLPLLGAIIGPGNLLRKAVIAAGLCVWVLVVWFASRGTRGPNRYGPDPFGEEDADIFA